MAEVLVIGGGVSGLSCGVRLREAGLAVTLCTREPPHRTTSSVAAAVWYPYKAWPEELVGRWAAETYGELLGLARVEGSGVRVRAGLEVFREKVADPWWRDTLPGFRRAGPAELPPGFADGYAFDAPVVEMPRYLDFLVRRFGALGGRMEAREVRSVPAELQRRDVVVNCTGLGARELVGDTALRPIRGQILRVAQVGLERFLFDEHDPRGITYLVPRTEDVVLGGTAEEGREELEPDPRVAEAILERCAAFEPALRHARVLEHRVGLRPGRAAVRLEAEAVGPGKTVVHDYGHGGAGVTLSWGCASEVVRLVQRALGGV
ncbi:MAG TPA: FAD-dependent oxidoreductase [Longimicrobium sp.]|nr:FAD-dependent oxidoreductase [Longimicrobium sp.]